jgi:SSS family solute:Na+ symporter/sodium/pantothenate symporter
MTFQTTSHLPGGSFLAGLILAAPFGAVMATVSSYLVVIASGLVRDVYQRFLNPAATPWQLRRLSYIVMVMVGIVAVAANIKPVQYLQAIVVFSGTSAAATFVTPALMAAFWRRANAPGVMAAMIAGASTMFALFAAGWVLSWRGYDQGIGPQTMFRPYYLLGLEPVVWGLFASAVAGCLGSLLTRPPDRAGVSRFFDADTDESLEAARRA